MAEVKAKKDSNAVIIEKYLRERAMQDPEFATKLNDPSKSIEKCMNYIREQARKKAVGGCAMIEDVVVFGWAVHYYDEAQNATASTATTTVKADQPTREAKRAAKDEKKQPEFVQLSLF